MNTRIITAVGIITIILAVISAPLAAAKADVFHSNVKYPVEYSVWHYCYGEEVHWSGYIQWVSQTTIDSQGGAHIQYHGHSKLVGIGEESGAKYESIWNSNSSRQLVGPGPWEFSETYNFRAVSQENGPVLISRQTWVTTISTSGEWSSYLADSKWYCEAEG